MTALLAGSTQHLHILLGTVHYSTQHLHTLLGTVQDSTQHLLILLGTVQYTTRHDNANTQILKDTCMNIN